MVTHGISAALATLGITAAITNKTAIIDNIFFMIN
jgi:hypothetical protein